MPTAATPAASGSTPTRDRAALDAVIKAYDVRGLVPEQIDEGLARDIGTAFARVLAAEDPDSSGARPGFVVGHDMRPSSPGLAAALAEGAAAEGRDVVVVGLASTDQLYFASGALGLPGAMITASHNPAAYNGIKLCRAGAAPVGRDSGLAAIRDLLLAGLGPAGVDVPGGIRSADVLADYAAHLRRLVPLDGSRPLTVVVDAGNGMAGHTVPAVLAGLPLRVVPLYFALDGTFPNHPADPLDPDNLRDLQAAVRAEGADLGLAFDGDADRCFVVDERGEPVSPSAITGLIAARELRREPGATIIHNLITSRAVPELVTELGGRPVRTRVGHSIIKARMAETGAVFGGEHSGHFYFRDFWRADSGMLAALHVLAALGAQDRPLSALLAEYARYAASGEINRRVPDVAAATATVRAAFADRPGVAMDTLDGLTVSLGQAPGSAWFNLRPSNTEPLLRLNVEAPDAAALAALRDEVLDLLDSPAPRAGREDARP